MFADDLAQATSDAVARDGRPERARSNEAGAKRTALFRGENTEQKQMAAFNAAICFDALKFARSDQSPALRKRKLLRRHGDCRS